MSKYKVIGVIFLMLFFCACTNYNSFSSFDLEKCPSIKIKEPISVRLLFLGDLAFGENYQETYAKNILQTKGYEFSFLTILPLIQKSTICIANLETPLVPFNKNKIFEKKVYLHYADSTKAPHYLKKNGINLVSLANNHAYDFGKKGLIETIRLLHKKDIQTFGAGKSKKEASLPFKIELFKNESIKNVYLIGVNQYSNSSFQNLFRKKQTEVNPLKTKQLTKQIQQIKQSDNNAFVIIFPHWGNNYEWKTESQTKIAKQIIGAGANLIIGHGAHRIQEIETLENKPVFYSIGNSVFNSEGRFEQFKSVEYSILVELTFNKGSENYAIKCYPILSNNVRTGFQPRFLQKTEFAELLEHLRKTSKTNNQTTFKTGENEFGYYFEIKGEI